MANRRERERVHRLLLGPSFQVPCFGRRSRTWLSTWPPSDILVHAPRGFGDGLPETLAWASQRIQS